MVGGVVVGDDLRFVLVDEERCCVSGLCGRCCLSRGGR